MSAIRTAHEKELAPHGCGRRHGPHPDPLPVLSSGGCNRAGQPPFGLTGEGAGVSQRIALPASTSHGFERPGPGRASNCPGHHGRGEHPAVRRLRRGRHDRHIRPARVPENLRGSRLLLHPPSAEGRLRPPAPPHGRGRSTASNLADDHRGLRIGQPRSMRRAPPGST